MIDYQTSDLRGLTRFQAPTANIDKSYTFYFDETNNIGKFYVRDGDFNTAFSSNFVLGGLVHEGDPPDSKALISSFRLQKNTKEVKFNYVASGDFLKCLTSTKLKRFLEFVKSSNLFAHYSSLNILYWSLVDIVDSTIGQSSVVSDFIAMYGVHIKNSLYKACKSKIDDVIKLFYAYEYPNVKADKLENFIDDLISLVEDYDGSQEDDFLLESLRQLLNAAKSEGDMPFIMNESNHILIRDLSQFYLRQVYIFKNSVHLFDNEDSISKIIKGYKIFDGKNEIKNYTFVESHTNSLVQLSDVMVGILGKLSHYVNTKTYNQVAEDFDGLSNIQKENIDLLIDVIDKSNAENIAFLHAVDAYEELGKFQLIRRKRNKP